MFPQSIFKLLGILAILHDMSQSAHLESKAKEDTHPELETSPSLKFKGAQFKNSLLPPLLNLDTIPRRSKIDLNFQKPASATPQTKQAATKREVRKNLSAERRAVVSNTRDINSNGNDLSRLAPVLGKLKTTAGNVRRKAPVNSSPVKTKPNEPKRTADQVDDPCNLYDVDGCSIPFGLPFFFKTQFTPSCHRHDICYRCGIDYSLSRKFCDDLFRDDMVDSCYDDGRMDGIWTSPIFGYSRQENIHLPRQKWQSIFREKASDLYDIFESEIAGLSEHFSKIPEINEHVFSSKVVFGLRKQVLTKWLLHLSTGGFFTTDRLEAVKSKTLTRYWVKGRPMIVNSHRKNNVIKFRKPSRHFDNQVVQDDEDFCLDVLRSADQTSKTNGSPLVSQFVDCSNINLLSCQFFARVYYYGVRLFGGPSYRSTTPGYCSELDVQNCLPTQF